VAGEAEVESELGEGNASVLEALDRLPEAESRAVGVQGEAGHAAEDAREVEGRRFEGPRHDLETQGIAEALEQDLLRFFGELGVAEARTARPRDRDRIRGAARRSEKGLSQQGEARLFHLETVGPARRGCFQGAPEAQDPPRGGRAHAPAPLEWGKLVEKRRRKTQVAAEVAAAERMG
jgi:hypothetical protein